MWKMKKVLIIAASTDPLNPYVEIHINLSVPLAKSIGDKFHDAHCSETNTSKSYIYFPKEKQELSSVASSYISMIQTNFILYGHRNRCISCDNAGKNMSKARLSYCKENRSNLKSSQFCRLEISGMMEKPFQEQLVRARVRLLA